MEYVVIASESPRVVDRAEDVEYAQREGLPPDWFFYTEAIERPLLRVLEVPLRSIDASMYEELEDFVRCAKAAALVQRKKHSKVRYEARWLDGHACKSGPPQQKLCNFFGEARRPAGLPPDVSPERSAARGASAHRSLPAPPPIAAECLQAQTKRACLGQVHATSKKACQRGLRQATLG